jgi:(1->4)-alpha-D-glucan 1-alpha-D-glucosylmutase
MHAPDRASSPGLAARGEVAYAGGVGTPGEGAGVRVPSVTYRLQLHVAGGFAGAAELVDYLDELGISDVYASPLLAAAAGSTHGYDVVDLDRVDPALGSEAELVDLAERLRTRGMGLVLDVVPNHMCISSPDNGWWQDVLENGPSSPYARCFDIDWRPPKSDLDAKVLLPILGDQYGKVLEAGELVLRYQDGAFTVRYHDRELPISPRTWTYVLEPMLHRLRRALGAGDAHVLELESILTGLAHLPTRTETDRAKVRERQREKEIIRRRLATLIEASPAAAEALDEAVAQLAGTPGDPHSVDRLEALLDDQGYRPCFWRVAADEINYRRFFDVNELAAIRVEEPSVMRAVHAVPLRLARQHLITGLRIDHIDGLLAPEQYLHDVRRLFHQALGADPYVVIEKILGEGEHVPEAWPAAGTTGYELMALLTRWLVSGPGAAAMRETYARFCGVRERFADVVYDSKKLVLDTAMSSELTVLAGKLDRISEQHRATRDFTLSSLEEALGELIACFPVYRTYVRAEDREVSADDRAHVELAVWRAKRRNPATSESIFDFIRSLLLLDDPAGLDPADLAARRDFVLRLQQLTPPVMAKGLEDTAFYRWVPLAAMNEVGCSADLAPLSTAELHRAAAARARAMPHGLGATATHDTKRSEDVRARLCVLTEIPDAWEATVLRLRELARPLQVEVDGTPAPDDATLYLLWQTLIGAWPIGGPDAEPDFTARIQAYMAKATREAKVHTSWISPNQAYDRAVEGFVAAVLDPGRGAALRAELAALHAQVEVPGYFASLAQTVLKIALPGVPDFYQGTELWDLSLVDPDNRRPVDFARRRAMLAELRRDADADLVGLCDRALAAPADGRIKLLVTHRALAVRRARRALFEGGGYQPLETGGDHADRIVGFARTGEGGAVIAVAGRHVALVAPPPARALGPAWGDTWLDVGPRAGRLRDALTGRVLTAGPARRLALADVLAHLPVALLEEAP